jgi:hypothetical protein
MRTSISCLGCIACAPISYRALVVHLIELKRFSNLYSYCVHAAIATPLAFLLVTVRDPNM